MEKKSNNTNAGPQHVKTPNLLEQAAEHYFNVTD